MTYAISKDIPHPGGYKNTLFVGTCAVLEVGDSFFAPNADINDLAPKTTSLRPKKFSGRTVTEEGVKGIRVWRIV